jgi:hypothetical protein
MRHCFGGEGAAHHLDVGCGAARPAQRVRFAVGVADVLSRVAPNRRRGAIRMAIRGN